MNMFSKITYTEDYLELLRAALLKADSSKNDLITIVYNGESEKWTYFGLKLQIEEVEAEIELTNKVLKS